MGQFLIERGHDGPARRGIWRTETFELHTPFLFGPIELEEVDILSHTFDRDVPVSDSPCLLILPSIVTLSTDLHLANNMPLVILPSLIGIDGLGADGSRSIVRAQLSWFREQENLPAEQVALRIPSSLSPDDLEELLQDASTLGIQAAVFGFDGRLGPHDMNSVILRAKLPSNWLVLATGRIEPFMIPLLYYLGFDGFDASRAHEATQMQQRLWRLDTENITTIEHVRYCQCSACSAGIPSDDIQMSQLLMKHNVRLFHGILSEAEMARDRGVLRWLVEAMTHASSAMAAILRRIDLRLSGFLEEFTPTTGSTRIELIGPESYNAPSVRRFRERLVERYTPPNYKQIVLLLPCSARKPYSESKSHRKFIRTIESAIGISRSFVAETIITSPLGVIPRELERIHPVANYNIPVTGDWDAEEIHIASEALVRHLRKFPSSAVIVAHLTGGYRAVVENAESEIAQSIVYTVDNGSATSNDALSSLAETLTDLSEILELKNVPPTILEETLRASADFQFGAGAGELLIPHEARLTGKLYHTVIAKVNGVQTCSFLAENGLLSLTLAGAQRLATLGRYWVRFDGERMSGGSLFAVAVTDADPVIRPGDEVIVINREGNVVGVGRSEMSGREMCEFNNGKAVLLRHKLR